MPTTAIARAWLDRWDRQQEYYLTDREERFAVIADVVTTVTARPDPLIVDLGCGPGSTAVRMLARLPAATVVGVDADPVLLGLARAAYADLSGLRLVEVDLRTHGWASRLDLDRAPDAIISTTALHWLTRTELAAVYAECGRLLPPGGAFVNGDHFYDRAARPRLTALTEAVAQARTERVGQERTEDWADWWQAIRAADELSDLTRGHETRPVDHHVEQVPTLTDHLGLLETAGFVEVGPVWQHGDDRVLVALR